MNRFMNVELQEAKRARLLAQDQKRRRREERRRGGEEVSSSSEEKSDDDTETDTSVSSSRLDAEARDAAPRTEEVSSSRRPTAPTPPQRDAQGRADTDAEGSSRRPPVVYVLSGEDGSESPRHADLDSAASRERVPDPTEGSGQTMGAAGAGPRQEQRRPSQQH